MCLAFPLPAGPHGNSIAIVSSLHPEFHRGLTLSNVASVVRTRIQKWGNSLALRIPQSFAKEARIGQESEVDLSMLDGKLIISALTEPTVSLSDLLGRVTDENRHDEVDTGTSIGKEQL